MVLSSVDESFYCGSAINPTSKSTVYLCSYQYKCTVQLTYRDAGLGKSPAGRHSAAGPSQHARL